MQRTVDGEEDVENGGGIEVGNGRDALVRDEVEGGTECFDGPFDAIAGGPAEFHEVLRGGDGDEEAAIRAKDAAEFGGVHAGGDGEDEGEGRVGVGDLAVGIGDNPLAPGVAAGRGIDGGDGDIDAVGLAGGLLGEGAEIEAVAAAGVENDVLGGGGGEVDDGGEEGGGDATVVEAAASGDGGGGVAGVFGAAVLGLEKVGVAGAGHVEGVAAGAEEAAVRGGEGLLAVADGANEHSTEFSEWGGV